MPKIFGKLRSMGRVVATREQIERLIDGVLARFEDLGLTDKKLAAKGGPSTTTMTGFRQRTAKSVSQKTLDNLDAGLDWREGSALGLLMHGRDPQPLEVVRGTASVTLPSLAAGAAGSVGLTLSAESRHRLVSALRNIRQSADEAVEILGG